MGSKCRRLRAVPLVLMLASSAPGASGTPAGESRLHLEVGDVQVLPGSDAVRVAVGNGRVVNAVTTDDGKVIVFARHGGSTSLQVWPERGKARRYHIEVVPDGQRRTLVQLRAVLEKLPRVRVSEVGDKLLVEGDSISDADRKRIGLLAKQYPQLLDFTGQVGWDRMVLLDVRVVEVPRSRLRELGVQWDPASRGGLNAGLAWDGGSPRFGQRPGDDAAVVASFPASRAAGYLGVNALLSSRINAMAKMGVAVVLAQPQLLARSGATAEFLAGGEVPYSTVDANGNTNTAFKPYGVSLHITPRIEHDDAVRSRVEVEVSSVDAALSVPGGPALKTRRAATEFNVRSGQTLVLAGFLSREASKNIDRVPGLASMPLLGRLFQSERTQTTETELAIFVTPVIVRADEPALLARARRGRAVVDATFPHPPVINVPVSGPDGGGAPDRGAPARVPVPRSFAGSQWKAPEADSPPAGGR